MLGKIKSTARSIVSLRRILSSEEIFKFVNSDLSVEFVNDLKLERILILSPHPDDETIGCGGAIIKTKTNDGVVKDLVFTDGSGGFPDGFRPSRDEKTQMAKTRKIELEEVQNLLGIDEVAYMDFKDSHLVATENLTKFITQTIKDFQPEAIFVPSLLDPNQDHSETARAFYQASDKIAPKSTIFQYELWSPSYMNFYLNIDKEIDKKFEAIKLYKSQLKSRNYTEAIKGLNRYRGSIYGKSRFAEGYLKTDLKTYRRLAELVF